MTERDVLEAGGYVRDSAVGSFRGGFDIVRVTFRNAARHELTLTVPAAAYRAHDLLAVLTPADFGYAVSS